MTDLAPNLAVNNSTVPKLRNGMLRFLKTGRR